MVNYMNKRIEKWDNIKFVLIFLVVFGHLCDRYVANSALMKAICFWIYTFHMPLFLFISGLFSKKNIQQNRFLNIFSYLILYFFIKIFLAVVRAIVYKDFRISLFTEGGVPWYAFALFAFSLITILVKNISPRYVLTASIIFACAAGYDTTIGDFLVLSRIIVYYPFFYAGYYLDTEKLLTVLSKKRNKIISFIGILAMTIIIFSKAKSIYWLRGLLTGRNPFSSLNEFSNYGFIFRLIYYPLVFSICFFVMSLVPEHLPFKWITKAGRQSIQTYALHYACIYVLYGTLNIETWMQKVLPKNPHVLLIPMSFLIIWFCSLNIWKKPFQIILKPHTIGSFTNS